MTAPSPDSFWGKYSWLMGAVWLFFLAFPLVSTWSMPQFSQPMRWFITAVITLFAAIYIYVVRRAYATTVALHQVRGTTQDFAALAALAIIVVICGYLLGPAAAGMAIYIHAYGSYTLTFRGALRLTAACLGAVALWFTVLNVWMEAGFMIGIMAAAGAGTLATRYFGERSEREVAVEKELMVFAERDRLASDIHDLLGHTLTVITMKSELAGRLIERNPQAARAELEQIHSLSREAMAQIRSTISGLHTPDLETELTSARQALATAGISADITGTDMAADPQIRPLLAWILRETITNVVRHSRATTCHIRITPYGLIVADDGIGPPPELRTAAAKTPSQPGAVGNNTHHNGLRGMSTRVEQAGGAFTITTLAHAVSEFGDDAPSLPLTPPHLGAYVEVKL